MKALFDTDEKSETSDYTNCVGLCQAYLCANFPFLVKFFFFN